MASKSGRMKANEPERKIGDGLIVENVLGLLVHEVGHNARLVGLDVGERVFHDSRNMHRTILILYSTHHRDWGPCQLHKFYIPIALQGIIEAVDGCLFKEIGNNKHKATTK